MEFERTRNKQIKVNMTPLIDMVFLLVVFFMLTTTFNKNEGIELLFSDNGKSSLAGDTKAILVAIGENGYLFLDSGSGDKNDNTLFPREKHYEFREKIRNILINTPKRQIQLYISGNATVQDVVTAIDQIQLSGGSNITFIEAAHG